MAIYTLAELETEITTYKAALTALAAGKTTQIGDQRLDRHDLPTVRDHLQWLDQQRGQLQAAGGEAPAPAAGRTYAANGRGR